MNICVPLGCSTACYHGPSTVARLNRGRLQLPRVPIRSRWWLDGSRSIAGSSRHANSSGIDRGTKKPRHSNNFLEHPTTSYQIRIKRQRRRGAAPAALINTTFTCSRGVLSRFRSYPYQPHFDHNLLPNARSAESTPGMVGMTSMSNDAKAATWPPGSRGDDTSRSQHSLAVSPDTRPCCARRGRGGRGRGESRAGRSRRRGRYRMQGHAGTFPSHGEQLARRSAVARTKYIPGLLLAICCLL